MSANRRKVLLINPPFQKSFLRYTLAIALLTTGVYFAAVHYFFWKFTKIARELGLSEDHAFFKFLHEQQMSMNMIFLVTSVIAVVILIAYGLLMSNRIAGPLYNLGKFLDSYNPADNKKIKFRDKDYFKDLEKSVNNCLERFPNTPS